MTNDKLTIAVVGAGAIGGLYGARLAHAGHDVHFLLRGDYEAVRKNGLVVDSYLGDFSLAQPHVYDDIGKMPKPDLVLYSAKQTANDSLFPKLAPLLAGSAGSAGSADGADGPPIILMQNGFGAEDALAELYPDAHIFGGLCFVCTYRESPGVIRNPDYEKISIAPRQSGDKDLLEKVAGVFSGAGIATEALPDLELARWRKLMWNLPYNGLSVVMDTKTDFLANDPAMKTLVDTLMREIMRAAEVCGCEITDDFAKLMVRYTERMKPYHPSMKLDFDAGRPMEIDAIYKNPIEYARAHGADMPYADALRLVLTGMEAKRTKE